LTRDDDLALITDLEMVRILVEEGDVDVNQVSRCVVETCFVAPFADLPPCVHWSYSRTRLTVKRRYMAPQRKDTSRLLTTCYPCLSLTH
jgi:hypothetical protein